MSSRNLAPLIAQLKTLLGPGAALGGLRFEGRAFERAVVPLELQGMHHQSALPDRARLFASAVDSLATPEELARLLALAEAAELPADVRALTIGLLSGGVPPRDNPILKLIFNVQHDELLARRN